MFLNLDACRFRNDGRDRLGRLEVNFLHERIDAGKRPPVLIDVHGDAIEDGRRVEVLAIHDELEIPAHLDTLLDVDGIFHAI